MEAEPQEPVPVAADGARGPGLPEPPPPPPWSLETARSLTAEGKLLMPRRPLELANFKLDTLLIRVQRVVPPSSGSVGSPSAGGV